MTYTYLLLYIRTICASGLRVSDIEIYIIILLSEERTADVLEAMLNNKTYRLTFSILSL